jgi:hypothetical protein
LRALAEVGRFREDASSERRANLLKGKGHHGEFQSQDDAKTAADPKQMAAPQAQDAHRLEDDVGPFTFRACAM